ncbi:hypothetical protein F3Y22_tig00009009pilonHSYRG00065 [Hibiscus syriacus]|uniref:CASP-like protein n=1 Tax=Hibiscus syriacus TaxID=106335 RepID=A0A6A3CD55_HIBSY|nr:hypothetical protein F3Y22_tig00009009pilonHSYRG00065 [Hibiscus syriacus]
MGAEPWKVLNQSRSKLWHHAATVGENVVGEEVPEAEVVAAPTKFTFNYSLVDVALRILLFAAALSSVVVIVTNKQTDGLRLRRKKMEQLTMATITAHEGRRSLGSRS